MSNIRKKNVKRFIEIISHNVAEDAYHGDTPTPPTPTTSPKIVKKVTTEVKDQRNFKNRLLRANASLTLTSTGTIKVVDIETGDIFEVAGKEKVYATLNNGQVGKISSDGLSLVLNSMANYYYYGAPNIFEYFYIKDENNKKLYILRYSGSYGFNFVEYREGGASRSTSGGISDRMEITIPNEKTDGYTGVTSVYLKNQRVFELPYEYNDVEVYSYSLLALSMDYLKFYIYANTGTTVKIVEVPME